MRIAYFDCSSGISGDMTLAAFIDAGLSVPDLKREISKLQITDYRLQIMNVERKHLPAKQVIVKGEKTYSSSEEIVKVVKKSRLKQRIKERALSIFSSLFTAERKVHRIAKNSLVHLDELANLDTLIDVVGNCIAVENFKLDKIYASPVNIGSAAPVAVELLQGLPVYADHSGEELTTPTGAAIISQITESFGSLPIMKIEKYGFGAGSKELADRANLLRLFIGNSLSSVCNSTHPGFYAEDEVLLLETNIDDMNPQIYPYVSEKMFKKGALDVWLTPVQMKKGRPGIVLSCLVKSEKKEEIIDLLFRETTTLGIRLLPSRRVKLSRKVKRTSSGIVYKIAEGKNIRKEKVEYAPAAKIAEKSNFPLKDILSRQESRRLQGGK